jgi:hypothetical protein
LGPTDRSAALLDCDEGAPLCTAESVLLDGANSATGAPRAHFPSAPLALGLSAVAVVAAVVLLRRQAFKALSAALVLAAVPGALAVLGWRADAPLRRPALAAAVREELELLKRSAPWPDGGVVVLREDDDVLFPLARYAMPSRPVPAAPAVQLELRGAVLRSACVDDAASGHRVCGVGP